MKKKRHKCREHHPSGELQNRFTLLTHTITTCKNQALSLPVGGGACLQALKLTDGLQLKRIFSSFQSASSYKYKMKIDTFSRFSKNSVRQRCDEIGQKRAPRYLRALLMRGGRKDTGLSSLLSTPTYPFFPSLKDEV